MQQPCHAKIAEVPNKTMGISNLPRLECRGKLLMQTLQPALEAAQSICGHPCSSVLHK
jgi:hypothetical protein